MGDTQVSGRREEAAYADYRCVGDDHWTAASSRRLTFLMDERYMQNYRAGFGTVFIYARNNNHLGIIERSVFQIREHRVGRFVWEKTNGA